MLRILHVIGKMDRAGAETMIVNLYRKIDRSEIQFDLMVFTDQKADYDDEIEELGGVIYHMPSFKGWNYLALSRQFDCFFAEHTYKIVHGHIGSLAPLYLKSAKKYGAYTIAHSHATNSTDLIERVIFSMLSHPVRYIADYFYACSKQAGIDRFGEKVVKSGSFSILNNGIDASAYRYSQERHDELKEKFHLKNKTIYGHVGRFVPEKNHIFLMDVFTEIQKKDPSAVLVMAGRGPEEGKIREISKKRQIEEKVLFLGIRNDVPDLMNLFDCFVFPSKHEGLGIVGIEAQAAGLPTFVADTIPEEAIITDHCWKLSLDKSCTEWACFIGDMMSRYTRKDSFDQIVESGYDNSNSALQLQRFYKKHERQGGEL